MATARSTPSMAEDPARIQELKEELYEACVNNGSIGRLYTQKDLFALDVVPEDSPMLLMRVVQGLTDDKLLVPVNDQRKGLCWKYRTREDAQKYINLPSSDAVLVYSIIDEAGADGIWSRAVLRRLGMHDATLKQALKQLESKGFISEMKSVEHPNKKMYIKANLKPSEKATGGPWYNDSTLDEAFIDELERVVFDIVKTQSTYKSHVNGTAAATGARAPKKAIKGSADQAKKGKKRSAVEAGVDGGEKPRVNGHAAATAEAAAVAAARKNVLRPLPAGYKGYPTTKQIAVLIGKAGIAKNQTLAEDDIQQLVDVLVFDGLIEPVHHGYEPRKPGYRATAIPRLDDAATSDSNQLDVVRMGPPARENGLTEAPCGKCPVFELCEEGGPVSPRTCIYYNRWLGLEEEKKPEVVEL
ncbi:hypothetical protein RB601_003092 [Gaeumannomyces tritici]